MKNAVRKRSHRWGPHRREGDEVIGDLIAEAMEKVGKDGVITVEEAKAVETSLVEEAGCQPYRGS